MYSFSVYSKGDVFNDDYVNDIFGDSYSCFDDLNNGGDDIKSCIENRLDALHSVDDRISYEICCLHTLQGRLGLD